MAQDVLSFSALVLLGHCWPKQIEAGDTRQHGAVEASDALLAIERHSGIKPVELQKIRRQDPALGRDDDERNRIKQYRQAVELAAAGKLAESFERLDKMDAVVVCGLGEQADQLADEFLRLVEQNDSAIVVSQTWAEVHHVNSRVRDALKSKGLLGAQDAMIQSLDKLDLTNAQKRDDRFYPPDAVIVFNQNGIMHFTSFDRKSLFLAQFRPRFTFSAWRIFSAA